MPSRGSEASVGNASGSGGTGIVRRTGWLSNQQAESATELVHVAEFRFPPLQQLADRGAREAANLVQHGLAHARRDQLGGAMAGAAAAARGACGRSGRPPG